jgi:preprotein translocase subunit SecE
MSKLTQYFKDTRSEMKQVKWPTREEAIRYTLVVIVLSIVVAALLGAFDFLGSLGLSKLLQS